MRLLRHQMGASRASWSRALCLTAVVAGAMAVSLAVAQPAPVEPPRHPGHAAASTDSTRSPGSPSDSIYATEITVDVTGVTVVDRSGKRQHLSKGLLAPKLPQGLPDLENLPDLRDLGDVGVRREDVVNLWSDITIAEDEVIHGDVVSVFGGQINIKGKVTGSVVSVFGTINIDGSVALDAVAPFGQVHVGSTGYVRKNVFASDIVKDPGGRIGGTRQEILFNVLGRRPWGVTRLASPGTTLTILVIVSIVFWLFLVLLAHALAARNVAKVKDKIQRSFFKSFFMGLVAQILALPATLLLLVTIVGIPVVIFLLPLMIAGAIVLSKAAAGLLVGEKLDQNIGISLRTPLARTLTGYLVLQAPALAAVAAIWSGGDEAGGAFLRLLAIVLFAFTFLLAYVIMTVGSGAVVLTRFGTRPKEPTGTVAVAALETGKGGQDHHAPTPLPKRSADSSDAAPAVS